MANYPMSKRVLTLDKADTDQLAQIIVAHELPPSIRIASALEAAFKLGYDQRNSKGDQRK
jgi:hypothetical protein